MVAIPKYSGKQWFRGKTASEGSDDHQRAVSRLIEIFQKEDFTCETGVIFWAAQEKGLVPFTPDVLVSRGMIQAVVEADGENHGKRIQKTKDAHRDKWFKDDSYGPKIPTVRYDIPDIVGRKKLTAREIMEEFWWKVNDGN